MERYCRQNTSNRRIEKSHSIKTMAKGGEEKKIKKAVGKPLFIKRVKTNPFHKALYHTKKLNASKFAK